MAGAATAALAAVIAVIAVVAGGRGPGTAGGTTGSAGGSLPATGSLAPAGSFTTVTGAARTISSLRGPTLVWFVATWCPSCQAGTQAMAANIAEFSRMHVRVVELEDYADLGQPGPDMASFGRQPGGAAYRSPDWVFGVASSALTRAYNPQGYLDIYFLLDSAGHITYVNSAPGSTMSQLLARAGRLT